MLKTRVILGVIILALMIGAAVLGQSKLNFEEKVTLAAIGAVPYITAWIVMVSTFSALDKQGRLSRKSLLYKYLTTWYNKKEETLEGKKVTIPWNTDYVDICPTFWRIGVGVALIWLFIVGISLFAVGSFFIIRDSSVRGLVLTRLLIAMSAVVGVIAGIMAVTALSSWLDKFLKQHNKRLLRKVLWAAVIISMFSPLALGVYWGSPYLDQGYYYTHGTPLEHLSINEARVNGLIVLGLITGITAGIAMLVAIIIFGVPYCRKTILGRIVTGAYHRLCLRIPVVD